MTVSAHVALEIVVDVDGVSADALQADTLTAVITGIVQRHFATAAVSAFNLTLHVVDDERIRALNAEHRGRDTRTDVLSFPLYEAASDFVLPPGEPVQLGDVVLSYERAVEQAHEYGHSVAREVAYLVAHGTLHLLGYDHETDSERAIMRQREEDALVPLGLVR